MVRSQSSLLWCDQFAINLMRSLVDCRLLGSWPETGFREVGQVGNGQSASIQLWGNVADLVDGTNVSDAGPEVGFWETERKSRSIRVAFDL
jgi:hypothetical protein